MVPFATTVRANAFFDGRPLAAPRSQQVSAMALATVDAEQLQTCSKDGLVLRLEDDEPIGDQRAVVPVDIGNPCWIWKDVDLAGVTSLRVEAVDLPFNFQFGADPVPGELRKQATSEGELEVALDGCDGKRVGKVTLGSAQRENGVALLDVPLAKVTGRHDLCLRFTRDRHDPLWAIDRIQLQPAEH